MSYDVAKQLASLSKRLDALEKGARLPASSVRGGFTRWLPDDGTDTPRVLIGGLVGGNDVGLYVTDEGGTDGIFVGSSFGLAAVVVRPNAFIDVRNPSGGGGRALFIEDGKVLAPLTSCAWQPDTNTAVDTGGRPTFTSASYVVTHRTVLPITSGAVTTWIDVFPGAGNTVSVKCEVTRFNTGGTYLLFEQTGITSTTLIADTWTVPDFDGGLDPIGYPGQFVISARRTAGASTAAISPRIPLVNSPS